MADEYITRRIQVMQAIYQMDLALRALRGHTNRTSGSAIVDESCPNISRDHGIASISENISYIGLSSHKAVPVSASAFLPGPIRLLLFVFAGQAT